MAVSRIRLTLTLCASTAPIHCSVRASDSPYAGYRPLLSIPSSPALSTLPVYSTVRVTTLLDLVKPLDIYYGPEQVEDDLMGCTRRGEFRIRVDHATETISFIDEPFVRCGKFAVSGPSSPSLYDTITVQRSLAKLMHTHLSTLSTALHDAVRAIDRHRAVVPPDEQVARQSAQSAKLVAAANTEHCARFLRKAFVARRELNYELSVRKEKEDVSCRAPRS